MFTVLKVNIIFVRIIVDGKDTCRICRFFGKIFYRNIFSTSTIS